MNTIWRGRSLAQEVTGALEFVGKVLASAPEPLVLKALKPWQATASLEGPHLARK